MSADLIANLRNDVLSWRVSEYVDLRPKRLRDLPEFAYLKSAEVSDDLVRCAWVLYRAYKGMHHVPRGVRAKDRWIQVMHHGDLATADGDLLTRLVVAAHDAAVRVEVSPGMRYVRIMLHPRKRTDANATNHPCIDTAVERMRLGGPACPIPVPRTLGEQHAITIIANNFADDPPSTRHRAAIFAMKLDEAPRG